MRPKRARLDASLRKKDDHFDATTFHSVLIDAFPGQQSRPWCEIPDKAAHHPDRRFDFATPAESRGLGYREARTITEFARAEHPASISDYG